MIDLPRSCPTPAANNNKKINSIGSDKLYQCSCELTYTYLLLVDSSSLYSSLFFMSRIETVLAIMNQYRTKYIPVSHVSLRKLVPGISPCQRINKLVNTKGILRFSACQNVAIMTRGINVQRSVTPVSLKSNVL